MSADCADLRETADLLHETARTKMADAKKRGCHQPSYVVEMRAVAALEEAAAIIEATIEDDC